MVPGVVGSSPISHPRQSRGSGLPRSPISFHIGASPSGKARDFDSLIRWFESSRPSHALFRRRRYHTMPDPVAQSAEQLPFKQWVRGSNPRRVTISRILDSIKGSGFFFIFQWFEDVHTFLLDIRKSYSCAIHNAKIAHGFAHEKPDYSGLMMLSK